MSGRHLWYAFRVLLKTPVVSAVAILSLALGIGANVTVFSLLNALVLRSLPVRDPQQLVAITASSPQTPDTQDPISLAMFESIGRHQTVFSSLAAWDGQGSVATFETGGSRFPGSFGIVSGDFYSTLGVAPALGRLIGPQDLNITQGWGAPVAVLDYRFWQRRYNGDRGIIGRTVRVDGLPLTIIGVTPQSFNGLLIEAADDVTSPIGYKGDPALRDPRKVWRNVVARLKPGVTIDAARSELATLWPSILAETLPPSLQGERRAAFLSRRLSLFPEATGLSWLRKRFSLPLEILMGLTALVLLVACLNLANLMLARAAARRHEITIRRALGASRSTIVLQMLTEALLLSGVGAAFAILLSYSASRAIASSLWIGYTSSALHAEPDWRVLLFGIAIAGAAGLFFGLAPAFTLIRDAPVVSTRTVRGGPRGFSRLLIGLQIACSLVLVAGALLLLHNFRHLMQIDPGFRREGILTLQLFPDPGITKVPNRSAYYRELADRMQQLPGVRGASYSHMGPANSYEYKEPVSAAQSPEIKAVFELAGPGLFRLLDMRLLAGRDFTWRDDDRGSRVVIVSESLAINVFPDTSPIGRHIRIGSDPAHQDLEIIGVVASASLWLRTSVSPPAFYLPLLQEDQYNQPMLDVRVDGDPARIAPAARRAMESLGIHYPLRIQTLEDRANMFLTEDRLMTTLSGVLGVLALLLASIGIYGLVSYSVVSRTGEIGTRMALGATPRNIVVLVVREVSRLAIAGIALGIALALVGSRYLISLISGMSSNDPRSLCEAALLLLGVALCAASLPARRASRTDPTISLRSE